LSFRGWPGWCGAFRKVERDRQRSSTVVRNEIENVLGETIKKSVFLLGIAALTFMVPLSVDIFLSVQGLVDRGFSGLQLAGMFLLSLSVMIAGGVLFTLYDRALLLQKQEDKHYSLHPLRCCPCFIVRFSFLQHLRS